MAASQTINRQWLLKTRPSGMVSQDNFEYAECAIPEPDLQSGQVLLQNLYLSFDPAMRGWMDDEPSYLPPVQIGEVMRASSVAKVIRSDNRSWPEGSLVQGMFGWQDYAVAGPNDLVPPTAVAEGIPPTTVLSVFGGSSLTAYFGMMDVGRPQPGETVLVSGAAGAVGSVVVQLAKLKGCRVIAIAGTDEKCQWLKDECGADEAINYKTRNIHQCLSELCPSGVDIFFDNVGGETLEQAIEHMADFGRIVLCGQISEYNAEQPQPGPANLKYLITRRIKMQGFIMLDYLDRVEEAAGKLGEWVMSGKIKYREDIQEGFDQIPATLERLFQGENKGKQLLAL
ncbi:NADP-dependent oxidoreductase [Endozoicomonas sp. OPT23]|uniref:NADP-dependent oxidoreductase n=1 Tax=Endozoicomonas sp. OPT23 TaxID=2072845 RepID=UPI00129A6664|nr:NADP-dependent oxidoreductase [Endozoicomonas sp. OPT23]MRI34684.1 NADP-dependent oxidoreductase [Endozoicomonas sp. OPT23]